MEGSEKPSHTTLSTLQVIASTTLIIVFQIRFCPFVNPFLEELVTIIKILLSNYWRMIRLLCGVGSRQIVHTILRYPISRSTVLVLRILFVGKSLNHCWDLMVTAAGGSGILGSQAFLYKSVRDVTQVATLFSGQDNSPLVLSWDIHRSVGFGLNI